MNEMILETQNLCKTYRGSAALKDVSLSLKRGRIYGLIGRNGAGKTTLMRIIAGLHFADSGKLRLFGKEKQKDLQSLRKRIGFMIEAPGICSSMTARENLTLHRTLRGIPNQALEDELLQLVGLKETGTKKAGHFSLGMKQRLGIAIALISSPEFLVLDEPINGLDPIGVVEIRKLLCRLCEERGMTILLSSHNLPELYQTATDYIMIDQGMIKKELTLSELEAQCRQYLLIRTDNPGLAVSLIEEEMNSQNYLVMPDQSIRFYDGVGQEEETARLFRRHDLLITQLTTEGSTLEKVYLETIGGQRDE